MMSMCTTLMFFCYFQMEVTFNFLEIRAMNTYPEHQVTTFFSCHLVPHSTVNYYYRKTLMSIHYRLSSIQTKLPTHWDCRPRTSWITWSATSTTPSPESSTTPFMRKHNKASSPQAKKQVFLFLVSYALRSENNFKCVGKLAASPLGSFPLQQPNVFLYLCSLHAAHFCVTVDLNTQQSLGLNQPTDTE